MTHIHQQLKREREEFQKAIFIQKNNGYPYWPNWDDIETYWLASTLRIAKAVIEEMRGEIGEDETDYWGGSDRYLKGINSERNRLRLALDTLERSLEDKEENI